MLHFIRAAGTYIMFTPTNYRMFSKYYKLSFIKVVIRNALYLQSKIITSTQGKNRAIANC